MNRGDISSEFTPLQMLNILFFKSVCSNIRNFLKKLCKYAVVQILIEQLEIIDLVELTMLNDIAMTSIVMNFIGSLRNIYVI